MFTIARAMQKAAQSEKIPRDYGTGHKLSNTEIHTLCLIVAHPETNVTQLAEILAVTKGAVSQTIKKLEQKGLVERYRSPENNKDVFLHATKLGEVAYHGHEAHHARADADLVNTLKNLSDEQLAFLQDIMDKLEQTAENLLKE